MEKVEPEAGVREELGEHCPSPSALLLCSVLGTSRPQNFGSPSFSALWKADLYLPPASSLWLGSLL